MRVARVLADVRVASTVLNAGTSYDEFALKMGAVGNRLRTLRTKYSIPLSRGDHKALGAPIPAACTPLYGPWVTGSRYSNPLRKSRRHRRRLPVLRHGRPTSFRDSAGGSSQNTPTRSGAWQIAKGPRWR